MGMQMDRVRGFGGGAVLAALVAGGLTVGAVTGAAPAQADCISVFGLGNGNGCTSNATTYAIAIGTGAQAIATGLFGGSLAIGDNALATMSPLNFSAFNFATAIGNDAVAQGFTTLFGVATQIGAGTAITLGVGNIAVGLGQGVGASSAASGFGCSAWQLGPGSAATLGFGNIAVGLGQGTDQSTAASGFFTSAWQLGRGSAATIGTLVTAVGVGQGNSGQTSTSAGGFGSLALNLFGGASADATSQVASSGFFTAAVNILGNDNVVTAATAGLPGANLAFNFLGSRNTVTANPGPLAIAGSIFQTGATVTKVGPGFNINGLAVPGVASVPRRTATSAAAASVATSTAAASTQRPTAKAVAARSPRKNTR